MRKILIVLVLFLSAWIFLARCVIMQNRWSDHKARMIFSHKKVPLEIHDTVINDRHLHYAVSGPDSLPALVFVHGSPGSWMNYAIYMWDTSLQKNSGSLALIVPVSAIVISANPFMCRNRPGSFFPFYSP